MVMKQVPLLLALVVALCVHAHAADVPVTADAVSDMEIPAPAELAAQVEKINKILSDDETRCNDDVARLNAEIAAKQTAVTDFANKLTTVTDTISHDKDAAKGEIEQLLKVRALFAPAASGDAATPTSEKDIDAAKAAVKSMAGRKLHSVLADLVTTASESSPDSTEYKEVVTMLDSLIAELRKNMENPPLVSEKQTLESKKETTLADVEVLKQRLAARVKDCDQRKSQFNEVIQTLNILNVKFENVTIPDCKPLVDAKNTEIQTKDQLLEEERAKSASLQQSLNACLAVHPLHEKCKDDLASANAQIAVLNTEVTRLQHIEVELTTRKAAHNADQQKLADCTANSASLEVKIANLEREIIKLKIDAKCDVHKTNIHNLEVTLATVRGELLNAQACCSDVAGLRAQKASLEHQLGSMSHLQGDLDSCRTNAHAASLAAATTLRDTTAAKDAQINKLHIQLRNCKAASATFEEQAKCLVDKEKVRKLQEELTACNLAKTNAASEAAVELASCKAGLKSETERAELEGGLRATCDNNLESCQASLNLTKIAHAHCITEKDRHADANAGLTEQLNKCLADKAHVTAHLEAMRLAKEALAEEEAKLKAQIAALKEEEAKLKDELSKAGQSISSLTTEVSSLEARIAALEAKVAKLKKQRKELRGQIEAKDAKIKELEDEIAKLKADLAKSNGDNEALNAEISRLEGLLADMRQEKSQLEGKLAGLEASLIEQKQFLADANKALEEANAKIAKLENEIEKLKAELAAKEESRKSLEATIEKLSATVHEQQGIIADLRTKLGEIDTKHRTCETNLATMTEKAKCKPAKKMIKHLQGHLAQMQQVMQMFHKKIVKLKVKLTRAQAEIATLTALGNVLRKKLKKSRDDHEGCKANMAALGAELASHVEAIKGHKATIDGLEAQLAQCQVTVQHTEHQWQLDRNQFKQHKEDLMDELRKLIRLMKKTHRKFNKTRMAMANELKVQDGQYELCRHENLNYQRLMGAGIAASETAKMKAHMAKHHHVEMAKKAHALLAHAEKHGKHGHGKGGKKEEVKKVVVHHHVHHHHSHKEDAEDTEQDFEQGTAEAKADLQDDLASMNVNSTEEFGGDDDDDEEDSQLAALRANVGL